MIEEGVQVKVKYDIVSQDRTKELTFQVEKSNENSFIGGPGIGLKVTQNGLVYGPTSSNGFDADGDTRVKIGTNAEWEIQ